MTIDFNEIPKIVINLKRRPDRLTKFKLEMEYMGWDYEIFEAIDTNSYEGCGLSHVEICKKFLLDDKSDFLLVMEDDVFFMPYSKKVINECQNALNTVEWDFFHLGPSIHRPLKSYNQFLIDLNNLPPKNPNIHRVIFGTQAFVLTKKAANIIVQWDKNFYIDNSHRELPIDVYFDEVLYKKVRSFCPYWLITSQRNDFSDINNTFDNNHYLYTYNWNNYVHSKIPSVMFDFEYCNTIRNEKN